MTPQFLQFTKIVIDRSEENTSSILILYNQEKFGTCISLLRQELDSLIRVSFLIALKDKKEIERLINDTINGVQWAENGKRITDRRMVDITSRNNSWATEVYEFGNCFTHLTNFHDYKNIDPLKNLDHDKKLIIKNYLKSYHQYPEKLELSLGNVLPYIPKVANKISNNLKGCLGNLKNCLSEK